MHGTGVVVVIPLRCDSVPEGICVVEGARDGPCPVVVRSSLCELRPGILLFLTYMLSLCRPLCSADLMGLLYGARPADMALCWNTCVANCRLGTGMLKAILFGATGVCW